MQQGGVTKPYTTSQAHRGGRPVELSAMPKPNLSCGRQTRASKAGRLARIVLVSPRAARFGGPKFAPADDRMSVDVLGYYNWPAGWLRSV